MKNKKEEKPRLKRHRRIRMKISGTDERPRLVINRSLNNLGVQAIDDLRKHILFALSTRDKEIKQKLGCGGNIKAAELFGQVVAQKAKEKGISKIIFDRAGYLYHGRIRAFAEALRKGGLSF